MWRQYNHGELVSILKNIEPSIKIDLVNSEKLDESLTACSVEGSSRTNSYSIKIETSDEAIVEEIDSVLRISGAVPLQFTFMDHNTLAHQEYTDEKFTEFFSQNDV